MRHLRLGFNGAVGIPARSVEPGPSKRPRSSFPPVVNVRAATNQKSTTTVAQAHARYRPCFRCRGLSFCGRCPRNRCGCGSLWDWLSVPYYWFSGSGFLFAERDVPEPSEKQGPIQCGRPAQADRRRTGARCGPQSPGLAVKTPAQAVPHSLHRPSGDRVHWPIA
jgi:hypothetical protein